MLYTDSSRTLNLSFSQDSLSEGSQTRILTQSSVAEQAKKFFSRYYLPFSSCKNFHLFLLRLIPVLDWLPKYNVKENFFGDLIGGLTVGVLNVPQGKFA